MKKTILILSFLFLASLCLINCNKSNNDVNGDWDITAIADAGGQFTITATADMAVDGKTFTATVKTINIGGAAEEHIIDVTGDADGDKLTVTNMVFPVIMGTDTNTVTLSATITIAGNALTGSGNYSEVIPGVVDPVDGTLTITGTKK